ncbi:unnamed protein product, partial [Didymodactylos carnosus]
RVTVVEWYYLENSSFPVSSTRTTKQALPQLSACPIAHVPCDFEVLRRQIWTIAQVIVRTVPTSLRNISCDTTATCGCQVTNPTFNTFTGTISSRRKRVIGGSSVTDSDDWPWLILIGTNTDYACTGVLVDTAAVLTTRSCMENNFLLPFSSDLYVDYGETNTDSYQSTIKVKTVHTYPNYKQLSNGVYVNDIALLILKSDVPSIYPPICNNNQSSIARYAVVAGYGSSDDATNDGQLRQAIVPTVSSTSSFCSQLVNSSYRNQVLCAGYSNGLQDACDGDSGAPLMQYNPDTDVWNLIGLVSTPNCGLGGLPSAYTRTYNYIGWDTNIIGKGFFL